jgi:Uncharacterized protein conserved in bacteria (DUF2188)
MSQRVLYVVPLKRKHWAIKNAVTGKLLSIFPTKPQAIDAARKIGNDDTRGLVVYGRQGQPFLKAPLKVTQPSRLSESKVRAAVRAVAKERQETYKTI